MTTSILEPDTLESTSTSYETITIREVDFFEEGDPGKAAHIVLVPAHLKEKYPSPHAYVTDARVNGFPIQALCGWTFIPKENPEKLGACSKCKKVYENDPLGHGDRDQLPDA